MRSKDKTLMAAIEKFVMDFTDKNGVSPTMQEVADSVGSSKATVQRYIAQMCEDGILGYSGPVVFRSTRRKTSRNTSDSLSRCSVKAISSFSVPTVTPWSKQASMMAISF